MKQDKKKIKNKFDLKEYSARRFRIVERIVNKVYNAELDFFRIGIDERKLGEGKSNIENLSDDDFIDFYFSMELGIDPDDFIIYPYGYKIYNDLEEAFKKIYLKRLKENNGGIDIKNSVNVFEYTIWVKVKTKSMLNKGKYYYAKESVKERIKVVRLFAN